MARRRGREERVVRRWMRCIVALLWRGLRTVGLAPVSEEEAL